MSVRDYLLGRIEKGLPSYLRNMPEDQIVSNPYIRGKFIAHERGRAASHLIARNEQKAQRIAEKYARTARKRDRLRNPPAALADMVNSHYDKQRLLAARSRIARVQGQGKWARNATREIASAPRQGRLVQVPRRQYTQAA